MDVTAICERSDGWWAVHVPEVDGAFTQAKRLEQVPAMVADAVSLLTGVPVANINVTVRPMLEDQLGLTLWADAGFVQAQARAMQDEAARLARQAVAVLREQGLSVRDVAALLKLSPQRVSQLDADSRHERPVGDSAKDGPSRGKPGTFSRSAVTGRFAKSSKAAKHPARSTSGRAKSRT